MTTSVALLLGFDIFPLDAIDRSCRRSRLAWRLPSGSTAGKLASPQCLQPLNHWRPELWHLRDRPLKGT